MGVAQLERHICCGEELLAGAGKRAFDAVAVEERQVLMLHLWYLDPSLPRRNHHLGVPLPRTSSRCQRYMGKVLPGLELTF